MVCVVTVFVHVVCQPRLTLELHNHVILTDQCIQPAAFRAHTADAMVVPALSGCIQNGHDCKTANMGTCRDTLADNAFVSVVSPVGGWYIGHFDFHFSEVRLLSLLASV